MHQKCVRLAGVMLCSTQKLKRLGLGVSQDGQLTQRASILGALTLYLVFVNLFLFLLCILGNRRR